MALVSRHFTIEKLSFSSAGGAPKLNPQKIGRNGCPWCFWFWATEFWRSLERPQPISWHIGAPGFLRYVADVASAEVVVRGSPELRCFKPCFGSWSAAAICDMGGSAKTDGCEWNHITLLGLVASRDELLTNSSASTDSAEDFSFHVKRVSMYIMYERSWSFLFDQLILYAIKWQQRTESIQCPTIWYKTW